MGDLGRRQDKGRRAIRASLCNDVRSDEAGQSGSKGSASAEILERRVTAVCFRPEKLDVQADIRLLRLQTRTSADVCDTTASPPEDGVIGRQLVDS
jgi:hypothetical protein